MPRIRYDMREHMSLFVVGKFFVCSLGPLVLNMGCAAQEREVRMQRGYVFFCDGSGGGTVLVNYARGVRQGLRNAGYEGAGEMFNWHTGLGVASDHTSSVKYKRKKAAKLAQEVQEPRTRRVQLQVDRRRLHRLLLIARQLGEAIGECVGGRMP